MAVHHRDLLWTQLLVHAERWTSKPLTATAHREIVHLILRVSCGPFHSFRLVHVLPLMLASIQLR